MRSRHPHPAPAPGLPSPGSASHPTSSSWQGAVASAVSEPGQADYRHENPPPGPAPIPRSAFAGFCFPSDVIVLAVRWYLSFALSYRDVEELLAERGIEVDHVTIYRWVQRFTPLLAEAARPCRHAVGDRWFVDETYVKVAGQWRYVYRAIDQFGQVIDVFVSPRRDAKAARRFFKRVIGATKVMSVGGHHRSGAGGPGGTGGAAAGGVASHRTVCQQPGRVRSRPPEGAAQTDARAQAGPWRHGCACGACRGAERSPQPLRASGRGPGDPTAGRRV